MDDLPVIKESEWQQAFPQEELPVVTESQFNQLSPAPTSISANRTPGEAAGGGLMNVFNGISMGWGDELVGAGAGALDYATNKIANQFPGTFGTDERSFSDFVSERTAQAKEMREGVKQDAPILATTAEIGGAISNPATLVKGLKTGFASVPVLRAAPGVLALGTDAAIQGATWGAGSAKEGERLEGAKKGAALGALLGGGIGATSAALSKIPSVARKAADKVDADLLTVTKADLKKSAKYGGLKEGETKLMQAVRGTTEAGTFKGASGPLERFEANKQAIEQLDGALLGTLQKADELRGAQTFYPRLKNAEELVAKAGFKERPALEAELELTKQLLSKELDGSLASMQKAKIGLNSAFLDSGKVSSKLDAAVRKDLKEAIEAAGEAVSGKSQLGTQIKQLNTRLGHHLEVGKVLQRAVAQESGETLSKYAMQAIRTSGGIGVPLLGGAVAGNPLLGAVLGVGLLTARSEPGKKATSAALKALANRSGKVAVQPEIAQKALLPLLGRATENTAAKAVAPQLPQLSTVPSFASNSAPTQTDTPTADRVQEEPSQLSTDAIVKALIQTESAGNPKAVSPIGAKGLGQLMDATGQEWAQKLGVKYDPFDSEQNLQITKLEFERLRNKYDDIRLALAAYNWGQGNLDRLIARKGTVEFDELEPFLPKETRQHNARTLANLSQIA